METIQKAEQLASTGIIGNIDLAIQLLKSQEISPTVLISPFRDLIKYWKLKNKDISEILFYLYSKESYYESNTQSVNQTDIPYLDYDPDDLDLKKKKFPLSFWKLKRLKSIHVYNQSISAILPEIEGMKKLKSIKLNYCGLSKICDEIGSLSLLESIDLPQNSLTSIPASLSSLQDLKSLNLSKNKISCLPESLGLMKNLESLNLSQNKISTLPQSLGQLKKLKYLNLSKNPISENLKKQLTRSFSKNILVF